jgi:lipid-A-disaccharide synthase
MSRTVLVLAGEASGDEHAATFVAELQKREGDLRFVGTGGPRMEAEGVELLAGLDDLAVMGVAEVLPRLPFFRRLKRNVERILDARDVPLTVLVDYPGFNLRIAGAARRRASRVLYYIAPKAWAWGPRRARRLAEVTDRVAAILPFEVEFFRSHGVHAEYVGHPLLDRSDQVVERAAFAERSGLEAERPILALLPGSRRQEVERHLGPFLETAERVRAVSPEVQPVLSRSPNLPATLYAHVDVPVADDARALLRHAAAALVKSGTATLEAALECTPTVVAYRTSPLTWAVARLALRTRYVSLPNLVAGAPVVPELLQRDATPARLAQALVPLLDPDSPERAAQLTGFRTVRGRLGSPGAAGRVADIAMQLLGGAT